MEVVEPDLGDLDDARTVGIDLDAELIVLAEDDRLPILEPDPVLVPRALVREVGERLVVEDVAVLVDLEESRAVVLVHRGEHGDRVVAVHVDRPGDEGRLRPEGEAHGVERPIQRPHGAGLRRLPHLGGRRVLALGEAVDLVIEQDDVEVDVSAERMDEVVATDRESIPITGDDPDGEVGVRCRDPRRDRGGASVDGVHAICVHVVRESARAADPADEDMLLTIDVE